MRDDESCNVFRLMGNPLLPIREEVLIGIVAKCQSQPMRTASIINEVRLFDEPLNEPKRTKRETASNDTLKTLFVCCPGGYDDSSTIHVKEKNWREFVFDRREFPRVDQVILLCLDTPQLRFSFFGIEQDETGQANLEWIIHGSNGHDGKRNKIVES